MKQLLIALVLVAVGVAALGFYRGWFTASSGDTAHGVNVSVGVNQDKIREDEAAVKEKLHGHGGRRRKAPRVGPGRPRTAALETRRRCARGRVNSSASEITRRFYHVK